MAKSAKSTTTTTNANETVSFIQQYHQKLHVLTNFYCVLLRQLGRRRYSPITFLHSRHADSSLHTAEGRKLQYLQFSYLRLALVGFTCSFPRALAMFFPCNSLASKNRFNKRTAKMFPMETRGLVSRFHCCSGSRYRHLEFLIHLLIG